MIAGCSESPFHCVQYHGQITRCYGQGWQCLVLISKSVIRVSVCEQKLVKAFSWHCYNIKGLTDEYEICNEYVLCVALWPFLFTLAIMHV